MAAALRVVDDYKPEGSAAAGPVDVIDLFCGCGGLSLGFEYFGRTVPSYRLAGASDIDPYAASSYALNLPRAPQVADLASALASKQAWERLVHGFDRRPGAPLVLIGGPPCQGFSAHRKKNGRAQDERNHLVVAYGRLVERLQPDFVVMENVPELLATKHWRHFALLRDMLASSGFDVRAQIHNLAAFGVPQARFRALVLASRTPFEMPEPFLPPARYRTVRDAIGKLPPVAAGELCPDDPMHVSTKHKPSTVNTIRQIPKDGGRRPSGVGPECLDRVDGFRDVYGRLYWDRPANTITAYARNPASGRYVHPEQDRGLTVREAALLQGFPSSFTFDGPFDHRFLQIGNAVPPVFSTCLAGHVFAEITHPLPAGAHDSRASDVTSPTSNSFSSGIAGRKKGERR
jgi:DNA (cytosine-5)-methyltransferase 1